MIKKYIKTATLAELFKKYPFVSNYFESNNLNIQNSENVTLSEFLNKFDEEELEDNVVDPKLIIEQVSDYIQQMLSFLGEDNNTISSLTILPGNDKDGNNENFDKLTIIPGDIISIVGPTGSGKSRLLADIEWVAQKDTPTNRTILLNDNPPDIKWRFSIENKLVAQLSQNMNFVMDLSVFEFIELHAKSRMVENEKDIIDKIFEKANNLAGEKFKIDTPITSLSGGQSRALMIADTAILSKSPIILIDEIENAGIDKKEALSLLLSEDKIVLMATHDPMLALMGDKRIVIKNGGINKIIETTDYEREALTELESLDAKIQSMRNKLRRGESLND